MSDIVLDSNCCLDPQSRPQGLGVHVDVPNLTPWGQKLLLMVYQTYAGYTSSIQFEFFCMIESLCFVFSCVVFINSCYFV